MEIGKILKSQKTDFMKTLWNWKNIFQDRQGQGAGVFCGLGLDLSKNEFIWEIRDFYLKIRVFH